MNEINSKVLIVTVLVLYIVYYCVCVRAVSGIITWETRRNCLPYFETGHFIGLELT